MTGVVVNGASEAYDAVLSTIPMPLVSRMVPDLPEQSKARYDGIKNIGVACLIFKLKTSVTPHFWVNITDERIAIPGIVEFSNLRPTGDTIVFVPYYMPVTNPKWAYSDERLLEEAFGYLKLINPRLTDADLIDSRVGRLRYAQPVCPPGFGAMIPPVQTPVAGLQIADTCSYYPEDRGIAESVRYGRMMALAIDDPQSMGGAALVSGEFLRFLSTGGFAAVINLLSRHELSKAVSFEIAVVLSYLLGMLTAYVLARQFVFRASGRSVVSELKRFAIVNVFSLVLGLVDQHRTSPPFVSGDRLRLARGRRRSLHRRRGASGGELFRRTRPTHSRAPISQENIPRNPDPLDELNAVLPGYFKCRLRPAPQYCHMKSRPLASLPRLVSLLFF